MLGLSWSLPQLKILFGNCFSIIQGKWIHSIHIISNNSQKVKATQAKFIHPPLLQWSSHVHTHKTTKSSSNFNRIFYNRSPASIASALYTYVLVCKKCATKNSQHHHHSTYQRIGTQRNDSYIRQYNIYKNKTKNEDFTQERVGKFPLLCLWITESTMR